MTKKKSTGKITLKKTGKKKTSATSVTKVKRPARAFRTYQQAMGYLFDRTDYERQKKMRYNVNTFDLDRMNKFLKALGNPHKKIRTVHIAGTKGKGSTAAMLGKMIEANGYSVGLYTSPHVTTLHERIMINSEMINKKKMLALMNRVHPVIEKFAAKDENPTFFEIMTALAFLHFADEQVDLAVIETGLGGRLDSTNVVNPEVVGITSISIDHQNLLGSTLDSITKEKAGVIKKGVPVVTVPQEPTAMRILKKLAGTQKAPLSITGKDIDFSYRFESSREEGPHTRICLSTANSHFEHLRVPLPGEHQAINCGLALAMLDTLKNQGYDFDDQKSMSGLSEVTLPGRMEMVHEDPRILVDAAHNAASIRALMQAIGQHVPYDSMVIIFGCNSDKDVRGMLTELQYGADKVIFTRSNSPKAVFPSDLAEMYTELCGKMCQTTLSLKEAIRIAGSAISKEDLICVTGSFYLVGQAKGLFTPEPIK
ncbi:MAG: bifunctional folylpolyglutamate synthase/dihydrofolate synthase [Planctomycetota bacterium]|jgi:dihydrofolate synthase/folylpolyglutamate synthase